MHMLTASGNLLSSDFYKPRQQTNPYTDKHHYRNLTYRSIQQGTRREPQTCLPTFTMVDGPTILLATVALQAHTVISECDPQLRATPGTRQASTSPPAAPRPSSGTAPRPRPRRTLRRLLRARSRSRRAPPTPSAVAGDHPPSPGGGFPLQRSAPTAAGSSPSPSTSR